MTEETQSKTTTEPAVEAPVVSQEVVKEINKEIQQVESSTKDEIVKSVTDSNAALKAELEAIKQQNEVIKQRQAAEAEQAKLKAELEKEKNFMNEVNQKHIVPPSTNPTAPQPVQETEAPKLSQEQEWAKFDAASKAGGFAARMIPESKVDKY